jgi:hypothetical protein
MIQPPLRVALALLVLLIPLGFLIALRLFTSDDLEGVTFDPAPLITTPTEREVRDQQRVNVALLQAGDRDVHSA